MLKRLARFLDPTPRLSSVVRETDDSITVGSQAFAGAFRDRLSYDRQAQLTEIINLCRSNPIARRVIEITTEFTLGDGFTISSPNKRIDKIIRDFWNNPLNDMDTQLGEWADEAWRTGDLFILVSVDPAGSCYVRAIPGESIAMIETAPNDYRQEIAYKRDAFDTSPYPAYQPGADQTSFVLHYPLNRMVGATFGESDLLTVKYWIVLYQSFLENRARLNYFRQLFTFVLQRNYQSQAEKESYVKSFAANLPKKSGGILALGADEMLGVVAPQLGSFEAEVDGLSIKRMIATGAGLPMHYLAEPESSTRTTAEAAGTPTFKRFKSRQQFLRHALANVLQTVIEIRRSYDNTLPTRPQIEISVPDITERDNSNLAMAVQRITAAFIPLYNAKKITAKELIRLVYKFLAETAPKQIPDENMLIPMGNGNAPAASGPAAEPDPNAPTETPNNA